MEMSYTNVQRVRKLYKLILKLHKGLPEELNELGTKYVQEEFKRHKKCNSKEADIFMNEWTNYTLSLANQLGLKGVRTELPELGKYLSQADLNHFTDQQIYQLYELMMAANILKNKSSS